MVDNGLAAAMRGIFIFAQALECKGDPQGFPQAGPLKGYHQLEIAA